MFSSYIALNNNEAVKKAYVLIERYSIFISITVGLFIIIFSKELLSIFGEKYIDNYSLLVLLAAGTAFGTLQYVNNTLLISTEKNKELLANATLRIGVQLLLSFFLVDKIGVLGVVIARIVSLLVGQIIPIWIIYKLPYDLRIPREFYVGIIITVLIGILYYMIDLRSVYIKVLIFFLGFGLFCRYARYCLNDIKFFYSLLIKQNSIPI